MISSADNADARVHFNVTGDIGLIAKGLLLQLRQLAPDGHQLVRRHCIGKVQHEFVTVLAAEAVAFAQSTN